MILLPSRTGPAGPAEPGVACLWQAPPGRLSIVASKLFANDLRTQLRLRLALRPSLGAGTRPT
jgi:hypothetical protein